MIDLTKIYQIPTSSNSDLGNDESNIIHGKKTGLRLKQRTSSVDVRKDYSTQTWISLLSFLKAREYFITVNNFSIWRRHLSWAMPDGGELRNYMTQRYASNMVFMSLLLGAELGVLFNSSRITMDIRLSLQASAHYKLQFWIGISILISVVFTLLSLFTTFTAWGMVSAISDENSHCILRSSIGQYAAQLPQRFIIISIYGFLFTVLLFFFLLLPAFGFWSTLLSLLVVGLFFHVVTVFSAFGRIILHTGAIAPHRIFEESYEDNLLPQSLHSNLIKRARAELTNKTSVVRQYRRQCKPVNRELSQEEMIRYVRQSQPIFKRNRSEENAYTASFNSHDNTSLDALTPLKGNHKRGDSSHRRGDSKVRFRGDGLFTSDIIKTEEQLTEGKDDGEAPKPGTRPPPILKMTSSYEVDEENTGGVDNQLQNDNLSYRDKEKNWFSSIASSIDNTGSYPTPPTPRRKRHVSPSQRGDEGETATLFNNAVMHSEFSRPSTKANLYQSKNKPPPSPTLRNSILKARKNDDFQVRDSDENPYLKEKDYLRTSSQTDSLRDKEKDWFSSIASSTEKTESYPTPPGASHKRTESKTRFGEQAGIPTFTGRGARAESPRYRNQINQSHHQQQQDGTENDANCDLESGTQLSSEHASSVYHSTNLPIQKGPRENDEESRLLLGSDIYDNYSSFHADSD